MDNVDDFKRWGQARRGWSPLTAYQYGRRITRAAEAVDLDTATRHDLELWLDDIAETAGTRNAARAALRAYYAWRTDGDPERENPSVDLGTLPENRPLPKALTRNQADQLWTATLQQDDQTRLLVALMLWGGLRVAEARTLRREHLDDEYMRITGKGGKSRTVPIHPRVAVELGKAPEDGWVLPDPKGGPLRYPHCYKSVRALGNIIGVYLTPHVLRHTCATLMMRGGADIRTVQQLLGHADISTTAGYLRVENSQAVTAIRSL